MKLYASSDNYKLYEGNMLDMLEAIEPESIDAIVTDPPYGLTSITKRFGKEGSAPAKYGKDGAFSRLSRGFMGKEWDGSGIEYNIEAWRKCLEALKPGGYLLAFGGSRTYHRIACAIEDAGFEIRDCILWLYGAGFPKSMNIEKAINKREGVEFSSKPASGVGFMNANDDGWHKTLNQLTQEGESTELAKKWAGWQTCLKPAYEPIILARRPFKGSLIDNILDYGVGGLNIDECRVGEGSGRKKPKYKPNNKNSIYGKGMGGGAYENTNGRFPANVIHDGSEEATAGMPNTSSGQYRKVARKRKGFMLSGSEDNVQEANSPDNYGDSGSASRYFYCAKASKRDRDEGLELFDEKIDCDRDPSLKSADVPMNRSSNARKNTHPTVKPTALMQYLIRLVTPRGGVILDPFTGSGSTGKAAMFENKDRGADYKFIGIELTDEYLPIAKARIEYAKLGQVALPLNNKEEA